MIYPVTASLGINKLHLPFLIIKLYLIGNSRFTEKVVETTVSKCCPPHTHTHTNLSHHESFGCNSTFVTTDGIVLTGFICFKRLFLTLLQSNVELLEIEF